MVYCVLDTMRWKKTCSRTSGWTALTDFRFSKVKHLSLSPAQLLQKQYKNSEDLRGLKYSMISSIPLT